MSVHNQIDNGTQVIEREKTKLSPKKPRMYHVIFHNDDFTPFEFVEEILMKVFRKNHDQSRVISDQIHKTGHGVAGTYTRDICETKISQADAIIKETDYPLLLTMEPE